MRTNQHPPFTFRRLATRTGYEVRCAGDSIGLVLHNGNQEWAAHVPGQWWSAGHATRAEAANALATRRAV